jgi:hypothetical protein
MAAGEWGDIGEGIGDRPFGFEGENVGYVIIDGDIGVPGGARTRR